MKKPILIAGPAGKTVRAALLSATLISSGAAVVEVAHAAPPPIIAHFHADEDAVKSAPATAVHNARSGLLAGLAAAAAAAAAGLLRLLAPKQFKAAAAKAGEVAAKAANSAAEATKTAAAVIGRITEKPARFALLGAGGIGAFILALNSFDGNGWAGDAAAGFTFGALAASAYFLGRGLFKPRQKAKILASGFTEKQ
ncbi:MAG: hypothetical protein R3C60_02025 [Parvularculaceae bacterium]